MSDDYNQIDFEADVQQLFALRKPDEEATCAISAIKLADQIRELESRIRVYLSIQIADQVLTKEEFLPADDNFLF